MTPERWERVGALFDRSLAGSPEAREAMIRDSGEPDDVQDEVRSLLQAHEGNAQFLEPPSPFAEGAQIGAYRIVRLIGRGGMGVVYLAEDTRLHRQVALKALPPHLFKDERMRSRLRKEAQAAAALSHPSIATVYALEEIGDQLLIATEYLEGRTLRDELEKGPLPFALAMATALDIAHGLTAAHERGIAHRDLKPENIVRLTSGTVKILDFGLAKFDPMIYEGRTDTILTDSGIMAGTPRYMAPEQLIGQPTGVRTDQFAFGILVYEFVLGRHPFGAGPLPAIIARVLASEPDEPTGFDAMTDDVWKIVRRCLQKDPADRFASTAELVTALEGVSRNLTGSAGAAGSAGATGSGSTGSGATGYAVHVRPARREPTEPEPAEPSAPSEPAEPVGDALWWWIFHQLTATAVYALMLWPTWYVHTWLGRAGMYAFIGTLAMIILAGNLRIHLSFTARMYPAQLAHQRARVGKWIRAGDYGFSAAMVIIGVAIVNAHNWWGALFVSVGLCTALVYLVIEPTTARAAFGPPSLDE